MLDSLLLLPQLLLLMLLLLCHRLRSCIWRVAARCSKFAGLPLLAHLPPVPVRPREPLRTYNIENNITGPLQDLDFTTLAAL